MPRKLKIVLFFLIATALTLGALLGLFFGLFYLLAWISNSVRAEMSEFANFLFPTNPPVLIMIFLVSLVADFFAYRALLGLANKAWNLESKLGPLFRSPKRGSKTGPPSDR